MRPILEKLLHQHRARLELFLQRVSTAPREGATDDDSDQHVVVKDIIIKEGCVRAQAPSPVWPCVHLRSLHVVFAADT